MSSQLDKLKQRVKGSESKVTISTEFYLLAKEISCLPELIGREFKLIYEIIEKKFWFFKWKKEKLVGIKQLPMKIPTFIQLMNEMDADYKRQTKQMKESQRRGRR